MQTTFYPLSSRLETICLVKKPPTIVRDTFHPNQAGFTEPRFAGRLQSRLERLRTSDPGQYALEIEKALGNKDWRIREYAIVHIKYLVQADQIEEPIEHLRARLFLRALRDSDAHMFKDAVVQLHNYLEREHEDSILQAALETLLENVPTVRSERITVMETRALPTISHSGTYQVPVERVVHTRDPYNERYERTERFIRNYIAPKQES